MQVYYNDIEDSCQRILRANIERGQLPQGLIDGRNIRTIRDQGIWRIGQRHRQIHLFAGIGGFPLGFKWAGMPADFSVLTGGPPCQPFSTAGRRQGTADARYLWPQMLRFVRLLRPQYVVFENVAGLTSWGDGEVFDQVCADLEGEKYEVITPLMVPACAFGALHRRDRVWILTHCDRYGREQSTTMLPKRKAESTNGRKAAMNGKLSVIFVEYLMGYPIGWTDFQGWATQSSRYLATGSPKPSSNSK